MSSLASMLAQWFGPAAAESPAHAAPPAAASVGTVHAYPPPLPGLPALEVAELIAGEGPWLKRLHDAFGADQASFERTIGRVIERYAQTVHLLPATPQSYFRHAGGLFRMGLEVAFYALQASDSVLFSGRQTITTRAALEPRWRYAAFLAGLCSELHRIVSHLTVRNDRGQPWPAYLQPLALWLKATQSRRYQVRWLPERPGGSALGVVAMAHVVTPAMLHYLAQDNTRVVADFIAAVCATERDGEAATLARLVRQASATVIANERSAAAERMESPPSGEDSAWRAPASGAGPDATPDAARRPSALVAPARLHPAVREALRQIIASLDAPVAAQAATVLASGVFVPLQAWVRYGVDPALAVRALGDADMLAIDPQNPHTRTCLRQVGEASLLGVVIAPRCIAAGEAQGCAATPSAAMSAPS